MDMSQPSKAGYSVPLWYADHSPEQASLKLERRDYDVVIVGAGISGLSVAYHALRAGRSVLVIDKGPIGGGETGRTSAHLSNALDDHFHVLERVHGRDGARLAAESHRAAIEDIFAIAEREQIPCDAVHVDGYLFARPHVQQDVHILEAELAAAQRAGLTVDMIDRAPLSFTTGPALRFRDQAQFEPMAYLQGLARAIRGLGGELCTGLHVESIEEGEPALVHLRGGDRVRASSVVVATNTPINDLFAIHSKQAPYRTYMIAVEIPVGFVERGLYWDLEDPYHYLRLVDDNLLLVGGEDHKVGQERDPAQSWQRLLDWTRSRFPTAGELRSQWSGQVLEPADGLAFIGRNPGAARNMYVVTGDSGNGITHGALAGLLITDLLTMRDNPWHRLYDPSRKITHPVALREFVRENVNVALQYADWVRPSENHREHGRGTVERRGIHRVAVYCGDNGVQHECSARCPHLGGVVHWNAAEGTWDCPLHGSRFARRGEVLTGPATANLSRAPADASVTANAE